MPRSDDRFARQIRGELPPEFPLASPCPSIDHHLSGTSTYAPAANELNRPRPHCSIVQQNFRSCVCNFSISLRRWLSRLDFSREREKTGASDSRTCWTPWSVFQDGSEAT